ncbi:MAG: translation initiation factor IF-2 [Clostridia bacterium]|nr:translation initiation factor IF-2 [Clostridia bacterium]
MAQSNIKVQEFAKDLKVTAKDVIEKLAGLGVTVKSGAALLDEEYLGILMDIYTKEHDMGDAPIIKAPSKKTEQASVKKESEEKKEIKAETKETEVKAEKKEEKPAPAEKKSENTEKENSKKAAAKKTVKEEAKKSEPVREEKSSENKVRDKQNENKEKAKKKAEFKKPALQKKKSEKIELKFEANDDDKISVTDDSQNVRYVDTRTSTVELEKIESRERLENLVSEDMRDMAGGRSKKKKKNKNEKNISFAEKEKIEAKKSVEPKKKEEPKNVEIPETITVGEFAQKLGKSPAEIVKKLMMLGVMATLNQSIDFDTALLIADDYGIEVKKEIVLTKEDILFEETEDDPSSLVPRPPVVVVMGHVDHGKTSLLDAIRNTSVTDTEAGGITQHIGAYTVRLKDRDITFLDTPGHEAFTTMRARGAQVTDVAILVVAADDGIMPQTIEAINHAKAAGVTIVVAINKIDKENANVERVKQMLVEHELVPEEWGGDTVCVEISAKKKINIDTLLEMVLLIADMKELKANPDKAAKGTVIEAQIDKGRGPIATVLVQDGTLNVGDVVIAGTAVGHVRAMVNDKGRRVKTAGPSTPVEILGLSEAPSGGDIFRVVKDEKLARDVAESRKQEQKENRFNATVKVSLDNLFSQIDEGNMKELNIIIKADVQGSVEAVKQSLEKLSNDEVRVKAIHGGVGAINESDVMLANASNAIIVGFNVRPDAGAAAAASLHEVDIRLYRVIYQAIEEIEAAMKGMLDPEYKEVVIGHAEVRQPFKVSGVGTIAGSYVTDGKITRNAQVRLVRDGIVVYEGTVDSLKRFKDDAKEVSDGFECGIGLSNFNDIKEADVIECYIMEEIER